MCCVVFDFGIVLYVMIDYKYIVVFSGICNFYCGGELCKLNILK